jgi:hypothetical protein
MDDEKSPKKGCLRFIDHNTAVLAIDDSFVQKLKSGELTAEDGEEVDQAMAEIAWAMRELVNIKPH